MWVNPGQLSFLLPAFSARIRLCGGRGKRQQNNPTKWGLGVEADPGTLRGAPKSLRLPAPLSWTVMPIP